MKKTNKKLAAGTLICALTSTGVMSAQAIEVTKKLKNALEEAAKKVTKYGLMAAGAYNLLPTAVQNFVKRAGSLLLSAIEKVPIPLLIGAFAMAVLIIHECNKGSTEECIENAKKEAEAKAKENNGISLRIIDDKNDKK